jgi:hypothetical protein
VTAFAGAGALLLSLGAGVGVGALLGTLGAGGSVVTVPILVYLLGEDVSTAATTSLLIVGTTAASGAVAHLRAGTVRLRTGLALAALAAAGSAGGVALRALLPGRVFLLAFAGLLVLAAALLWRRPEAGAGTTRECVRDPDWRACGRLGATGLVVGLLTGLFGVGGGFVVVPALVVVLAFPPREAVGTSLVVVALASATGLAASAARAPVDWAVALPFAAGGIAGATAGRRLGGRLPEALLRRGLAIALVALAVFLVLREGRGGS